MKGYIHIENVEREGREGLRVACNVAHVDTMDKFHIMELVCRTLEFTEQEWLLFVYLKHEGVVDKMFCGESVELRLPTKEDTK